MAETVGRNVGNYVGEFLEYDEKNSSDFWRRYMRIRVMVDVRKPLVCTKNIKKKGAAPVTFNLKYERLGIFCYYCGMIGHTEDSCEKLYVVEEDDSVRNWGPDIRLEVNRRSKDDGNIWAVEERFQTGQQPVQGGETQLNAAVNDRIKTVTEERNEAVTVEENKTKDMMAELIKQQTKMKALKKERIFSYEPISAEHSMGLLQSNVVRGVEEDIVESDKKRLRDGRNKDVGGTCTIGEQSKNHNPMQIDEN